MAMLERPSEIAALQSERADAIKRLPYQDSIYLPTERIPLPQQVSGLKLVDEIYRERLNRIYRPRLRALRAQYRNRKRAFIIGNGPSLKRTDLTALKDEVTFAVNGFFLKIPELSWKPTFYVVEDHLVAEDRADAINALDGPTKLFPVSLAYCINEGPGTIFFDHRPRKSFPLGFDFSLDASEATYTGCTVTNTVLQLAHYIGFREIYLIGVDANYDIPTDVEQSSDYSVGVLDMKSDDPNHFHPDYFGKGFRWHDPQVDKMVQAYLEAERTTRRTGRLIYNATVGGKLDVFQRVDYFDVLPHASRDGLPEQDDTERVRALAEHPRLLIVDMTRIGDGTATGEVKKMLLRRWPKEKLMQIHGASPDQLSLNFSIDGTTWSPDPTTDAEMNARIAAFRPQMILYRPVSERPALHDCAMRLVRDHDLPLALWIMDDWMERLQHTDPALHQAMDADLRKLVAQASALFAISAPMSDMLAERYGGSWQVFSNAIDPSDWTEPPPDRPSAGLLVRYAGGLAEDMTLESLRRIAGVIDGLAGSHDIRLELNTRSHWANLAGHHFDGLRNVTITTDTMHEREYRSWLRAADVVLITYNFDPATKAYVQYSMANKLPECLACGAVTLAFGPRGVATIDALDESGCARVLTEDDEDALRRVLVSLLEDREARLALGEKARAHAFRNHDLAAHAERFREAIKTVVDDRASEAAARPAMPVAGESEPADTAILRELRLLRQEQFANWIATSSIQHTMNYEAALTAALKQLRRTLAEIQDSMVDKDRRDAMLMRKIAILTDQVGAVAQKGPSPAAAGGTEDEALNAVLTQMRQDLAQIQEGILDNERRGAWTLRKLSGFVTHAPSNPVDPDALPEDTALGAAIAQMHGELTEIREIMAENERRDVFLLRKTTLLTDQMMSGSAPPLASPPRKQSTLRSIRLLPTRLLRLATGGRASTSTTPQAAAAPEVEPVHAPVDPAAFSIQTEWVDLKFDEVGVVLAWSLDGKPLGSIMAVRQQDVSEIKVEATASENGEALAPFSLIVPSGDRTDDELVGDLRGRIAKRLQAAPNPTTARFLHELNQHLPVITRTIA